jgi:hypothetical protein
MKIGDVRKAAARWDRKIREMIGREKRSADNREEVNAGGS